MAIAISLFLIVLTPYLSITHLSTPSRNNGKIRSELLDPVLTAPVH